MRIHILFFTLCCLLCHKAAAQDRTGITRFANGYVAVSTSGQATRLSATGEVTGTVTVCNAPLLCVASDGTALLAGGANGVLFASADGTVFSPVDSGVESDITSLTAFKGKWVAGTRAGQLLVGDAGSGFVMADVSFVGSVTSLAAATGQCGGVTASGDVFLSKNGTDWKVISFNNYYDGYYPACSFTAVCMGGGRIAVAGTQNDGKPALYFSTNGNVWSARELNYQGPQNNYLFVEGTPLRMTYQKEKDQFVLVFDNGFLLEVPPCSHCNKWLPISQNIF